MNDETAIVRGVGLLLLLCVLGGAILFATRKSDVEDVPSVTSETTLYEVPATFDLRYYPYYGTLSSGAQDVYAKAYAAASAHETEFEVSASVGDCKAGCEAMFMDHPEFFWLSSSYTYSFVEGTDEVTSVVLETYDFAATEAGLSKALADFNSAANEVLSSCPSNGSVFDKEVAIHDALNSSVTYASSAEYGQSAYSALVCGTSVCAGYSKAFQYLMQQEEIPCYYVTGTAIGFEGDSAAHAWNIVKIGNAYCNIDVSWDDTIGEVFGQAEYPFFNVTDADFEATHSRSSESSLLAACTDSSYMYSNVNGGTITVGDIVIEDGVVTIMGN